MFESGYNVGHDTSIRTYIILIQGFVSTNIDSRNTFWWYVFA